MRFEKLTTVREDADTMYETEISDAEWIVYDIPGNIGWMTYLAVLAKMIRDREYWSAAVSAAPAVLMIAGVAELISERIEGLDRELPKKRLYRGFGALTLGGITGIVAAAVADSSKMNKSAMGGGAMLCAVFAGLLLRGYRISDGSRKGENKACYEPCNRNGKIILCIK